MTVVWCVLALAGILFLKGYVRAFGREYRNAIARYEAGEDEEMGLSLTKPVYEPEFLLPGGDRLLGRLSSPPGRPPRVPSRRAIAKAQTLKQVAELRHEGFEITGMERFPTCDGPYRMHPKLAHCVDPMPPIDPLDIPSRALVEMEGDLLAHEFFLLEREVEGRAT